MNLNLLKTYIRVVETQNLSRTAKELGVSQPAVTKQIQTLEDVYGVLLLERSGRNIKTTEAGKVLYQCAQDIVAACEKTHHQMQAVLESQKGVLAIGASSIPGQYILPAVMKEFKDRYPQISISMDISDTEKIFARVSEWELDVGIVGGWQTNRRIEGFKWLKDDLTVIVPQGHPLARQKAVSAADLLEENWILREKGSGTRKIMEEILALQGLRKEDIHVYMEVGSTEAIIALVEEGMGISIISTWALKKTAGEKRFVSLEIIDKVDRFFYVIYPRQKNRRKSVASFLEFIAPEQFHS